MRYWKISRSGNFRLKRDLKRLNRWKCVILRFRDGRIS